MKNLLDDPTSSIYKEMNRHYVPASMRAFDPDYNCTRCGLYKTSFGKGRQLRCMPGCGPYKKGMKLEDVNVVLVGEAPGEEEIYNGFPFVGDSGMLLDRILHDVGVDQNEFYITNAVKCRPTNNRTPSISEIFTCRPYLVEELRSIKPKVIVTLGEPALISVLYLSRNTFLEDGELLNSYDYLVEHGIHQDINTFSRKVKAFIKKKFDNIERMRGNVLWSEEFNCYILPTIHPAAALRKTAYIPMLLHDLGFLKDISTIEQRHNKIPTEYRIVKSSKEAEDVLNHLTDIDHPVAIDTETSGFDFKRHEILCVSLSWKRGKAVVIPLVGQVDRKEYPLVWELRMQNLM